MELPLAAMMTMIGIRKYLFVYQANPEERFLLSLGLVRWEELLAHLRN